MNLTGPVDWSEELSSLVASSVAVSGVVVVGVVVVGVVVVGVGSRSVVVVVVGCAC